MTATEKSPEVGESIEGFILGFAVGDALGLPREGISPRRSIRIFGGAPLSHAFFFNRGMVSDDTEHLLMTANSLLSAPDDSTLFARQLAWKLRWWLLALPAGVGMATAKSIVRLWLGWPTDRSGVRSAGNGPAMRAGIMGVCFSDCPDRLKSFVEASTRLTHRDQRADDGALIIALAASWAIRHRTNLAPDDFFAFLHSQLELTSEWLDAIEKIRQAIAAGDSAAAFADKWNWKKGVSGYIVHTVSAVLFCWLRWPGEYRRPLEEIILLGGDTDTTAAILGGLAGATCGSTSIPQEWINGLMEWPDSVAYMRSLSSILRDRFHANQQNSVLSANSRNDKASSSLPSRHTSFLHRNLVAYATTRLVRNLFFLSVVLFHGFRRLLPPYCSLQINLCR